MAHEWRLLYSMDQHGSSLQTLFYNVQKHLGPCLLVIQTTDEEVNTATSKAENINAHIYFWQKDFWRLPFRDITYGVAVLWLRRMVSSVCE